MMEKKLIVNGDDFGMSRSTTDAIVLAHRYGFLTSTSLMANMPAASYAITRLAKLPRLGVGVHLNICSGRPILPPGRVPSLVDAQGRFHRPKAMIRKLWQWRVSAHEIEAEFRAQIQWLKVHGVVLTHADSHHHMHIYPAAVAPFVRALTAEGIRCTRAPRSTVWSIRSAVGGPYQGSIGRRLLVQSYRRVLQVGPLRSLHMPHSRVCFVSCGGGGLDALGEQWKAAFANLPTGTFELACHPGLFERGFSEGDPIHLQREAELHWLTSKEWRTVLDGNGIKLVTYRELLSELSRAAEPAAAKLPVLE
jgi:chitin disaccharide deacetylase